MDSSALARLGARLREERVLKSLTQADFAKLGGVSTNTQAAYEAGRSPVTADYLLAVAEHGVDAGYVLTGRRVGGDLGVSDRMVIDAFGLLSARERDAVMQLILMLTGSTVDHMSLARSESTDATIHSAGRKFMHKPEE